MIGDFILSSAQLSLSDHEEKEKMLDNPYVTNAKEKFIRSDSTFQAGNTLVKPRKLNIFEFIWMEISRYDSLPPPKKKNFFSGYSLHNEQDRYAEKRKKVYAFLRIPMELEKFIFFGFRQCLDAFCHMFTFLPLRIIVCFFILLQLKYLFYFY